MIDNLTEAIAHARKEASKQRRRFEDIYCQEETTEEERKEAIACLDCSNEHGQLVAWLTELQERREADRWRSISEPPKEHDYYLVTCEFGVASATDIALFYPDRKGEEQWSLNYVTAWKPLPEPYESEAAK